MICTQRADCSRNTLETELCTVGVKSCTVWNSGRFARSVSVAGKADFKYEIITGALVFFYCLWIIFKSFRVHESGVSIARSDQAVQSGNAVRSIFVGGYFFFRFCFPIEHRGKHLDSVKIGMHPVVTASSIDLTHTRNGILAFWIFTRILFFYYYYYYSNYTLYRAILI